MRSNVQHTSLVRDEPPPIIPLFLPLLNIHAPMRREVEPPSITPRDVPRSTIHAPQGGRESARSLSASGKIMISEQKKIEEMGRNPRGVFKTMKKLSTRFSAIRKARRKMERIRGNKFCGYAREFDNYATARHVPIHFPGTIIYRSCMGESK